MIGLKIPNIILTEKYQKYHKVKTGKNMPLLEINEVVLI